MRAFSHVFSTATDNLVKRITRRYGLKHNHHPWQPLWELGSCVNLDVGVKLQWSHFFSPIKAKPQMSRVTFIKQKLVFWLLFATGEFPGWTGINHTVKGHMDRAATRAANKPSLCVTKHNSASDICPFFLFLWNLWFYCFRFGWKRKEKNLMKNSVWFLSKKWHQSCRIINFKKKYVKIKYEWKTPSLVSHHDVRSEPIKRSRFCYFSFSPWRSEGGKMTQKDI